MNKILHKLHTRGIESFTRFKSRWFNGQFVRGCKDKHIYVKKKKVRYRNYKPKIISISLAFQYLTIKYLIIGYFNIDYLVKCTNCYNISRGKGTFTSLSYQNQFFSPFQSFCPSRRVLNPIS